MLRRKVAEIQQALELVIITNEVHLIVEDEGARVPSVTSRRPGKTIGLERRGMILARLTRSSRQFGRLNTYRALPFLG